MGDIEYHEINEALVCGLANVQLRTWTSTVSTSTEGCCPGALCGSSEPEWSVYNVLKQNDATLGCPPFATAGGASAIVIEVHVDTVVITLLFLQFIQCICKITKSHTC